MEQTVSHYAANIPHELVAAYERVCNRPTDMFEHCPTLRRLARQCRHVTEFGMREGVSTTALLLGVMEADPPGHLLSIDEVCYPRTEATLRLYGGVHFSFLQGNSLRISPIEPTDLLMIDTVHTGSHLYAELWRHAASVRKYIVMHDTELFGEQGDDGKEGMRSALSRFVGSTVEGQHWFVRERYKNCCGLTVLERQPSSSPLLPLKEGHADVS